MWLWHIRAEELKCMFYVVEIHRYDHSSYLGVFLFQGTLDAISKRTIVFKKFHTHIHPGPYYTMGDAREYPEFKIPKEGLAGVVKNEGPNFEVEVKMVPVPEIGMSHMGLFDSRSRIICCGWKVQEKPETGCSNFHHVWSRSRRCPHQAQRNRSLLV